MTPLQQRTLMYIENYWTLHGVGPKYLEMACFFKCSTITMYQRCMRLHETGMLVFAPRQTGSICLTEEARLILTRRDNVKSEQKVVKYLQNLQQDLRVPYLVRDEIGAFLKGNNYEQNPITRARPGTVNYRTQ